VSTDPGIWGWTSDIGHLGFTVTFSLGLTPEDVLTRYGADKGWAQQLSRDEAWARYRKEFSSAHLRVGTLGRWGFCFEEAGVEGIHPRTLSRLSAETETLAFFTSTGTSSFIYLKDGEGVEAFEPGLPDTVLGNEPRKFWNETQKILERASQTAPMSPTHAVLQAITKHVRGPLDRATLEGPLLTVFLSRSNRSPANAYFDDSPAATTPLPTNPVPAYPGRLSAASLDTGPRPVMSPAPNAGYGPTTIGLLRGEARAS
jgi:Family of unknown function (DUF6461)